MKVISQFFTCLCIELSDNAAVYGEELMLRKKDVPFVAKRLHLRIFCCIFAGNILIVESVSKIKESGLKLTPQRRMVYEAMAHLHHAAVEDIVSFLQAAGENVTVSTVYRILDSFCKAGLLSTITNPDTGKSYYDITVHEHMHVFSGGGISDYEDEGLLQMIRRYIEEKGDLAGRIKRIQVQVVMDDCMADDK